MIDTSPITDEPTSDAPSSLDHIDEVTRRWIRNKSDEYAALNGCRFDEERAQFVCDWIEAHCHLYEGSRELMKLYPAQRDFTMRLYGWVRWGTNLPSGGPDRWIRRFTHALIMMPKKGGKSPWLAATALYEIAADGEQGNHIAFAAADKNQANISARHAVEMVKASPDLQEQINVNLSEMKLTHTPTGSDAKPISSNDRKAAQGKQGFNGSVRVDELHVITPQFISESSLDRAGSSRDEPLFLAVSTAGKDPDSYGRKMYEHGKSVEAGETIDERFFFVCYEAPQDLSDTDLDAAPAKYGRIANPAWGLLTQEAEFLADYNRSKRSVSDLADFKTFRLNIWQTASSPWLNMSDWRACRVSYSEEDLRGKTAFSALDLSKVRDMTALAFAFPMGDVIRVKVYFFMPESAIKRLGVKVPRVLDWVARGLIEVTPGETTDYRYIKRFYAEKLKIFQCWELLYDDWNAEQVTQEIAEETGVERLNFGQNMKSFNEPMKDLEARILNKTFEHDGNEVLDWQVGHTEVAERNANIMPAKPARNEHKKIDGVVAVIMASAPAMMYGGDTWIG